MKICHVYHGALSTTFTVTLKRIRLRISMIKTEGADGATGTEIIAFIFFVAVTVDAY